MIVESAPPTGTPDVAAAGVSQRVLLADVRKDMTAIFGESDAFSPALPNHALPFRKAGRQQPPALSRRRSAAGPIACAALGGLVLGMAAIGVSGLTNRTIAPPQITRAATTVAASPFEAGAVARPAASTPTQRSSTPSPPIVSVKRPTAAAKPSAAVNTKTENVPPEPVDRSAEVQATADSAPDVPQCEGDRLERHWCMRHDILEADRNLRRAYANAIREGVERRYLVAHQRRWTQLRDRATRDPDTVLAGYRELTDDLERLAVNGRRRDRL